MGSYTFRLFVTGDSRRSRQAAENLRALCDARVAGLYELEVIDVLDHAELAEEDKIIATPTVIRLLPLPHRRVIGDLSDFGLAAIALELPDAREAPNADGDGT